MKPTIKRSLAIVALALFAATAISMHAQVLSQTNSYSGTPDIFGTLAYDKYNGGMNVTQIVITSSMSIDGFSLMVTNIGDTAATLINYSFGAQNTIDIVPIAATNILTASDSSVSSTNIPPFQSITVNGTLRQDSFTRTITDPGQISQFLGAGTFNVTYNAIQFKSVSTSGGTTDVLTPSTASGNVIVNFFTAIPEPSTYAMIGGGILVLLALKRKALRV